jgi:glycosyltransferase involved in cell wall biosynthesis
MGHNAAGRPYFLADMLRRRHDVTLVGPNFPRYGTDLWEPIRATDVPMRRFPGADLPEFVGRAERAISGIRPDLVIACKPRFPALSIAMLFKQSHGVPVIADLDEWELGWTSTRQELSLDELEQQLGEGDVASAYGEMWTRAAEPLIGESDAVTVASPILQEIYGGPIIPQARDELVFDPALYDRATVRAEYGYGPEDRVVLFLGSPKRFKGVLELAQALEELGEPRNKLCVIGSITDPIDRIELARVGAPRTQLVDYRPVSEVPRLTLIGDLVCLLQDPAHGITKHQLPAKLTEILAMGVPVLARETPPLEPLVKDGLISGIGDMPVAARIAELFESPDRLRAQAKRGREFFKEQLSYAATLEVLEQVLVALDGGGRPLPSSWARALRLARSVPGLAPTSSGSIDSPRPASVTQGPPAAFSAPGSGGLEVVGDSIAEGAIEALRDGVVWGWAWKPATPGWRVRVRALVDGLDIAGAVADRYRESLRERGIGDGYHAFVLRLPGGVARSGPHTLRIEAGGTRLPTAPKFVAPTAESAIPWDGVEFALEPSVVGRVDRVCDGVVCGWACILDQPDLRAEVRVIVDGVELASGCADLDGPELVDARVGNGCHGFQVALPAELDRARQHDLRVEVAGGVPIPASPAFATTAQRRPELWEGVEFHVEGSVLGRVEQASGGIVSGWAHRPGAPTWRVWVRLIVDGEEACGGAADVDRPELAVERMGDGRHGFRFRHPAALPGAGFHRLLVDAEGVTLPLATRLGDGAGPYPPL